MPPTILFRMNKIVVLLTILLILTLVGWSVSMVYVVKAIRPDEKPVIEAPPEPKKDVDWYISFGLGSDWVELESEKRLEICEEAAKRFKTDVAIYYFVSLNSGYSQPNSRHIEISSMLIAAEKLRLDTPDVIIPPGVYPLPGGEPFQDPLFPDLPILPDLLEENDVDPRKQKVVESPIHQIQGNHERTSQTLQGRLQALEIPRA